ncbi:MAG: hypothetical protein ACJAVZ_005006 [Afipia broomeae]|jgi:uncharacterized protein (TIGR02246 family)|uniref:DUF4440 domain-containing protein n=2 Tax=Pseudomonadota TaxID=1224 RepID=K8PKA7_9BRAD|nr:SgcJ/EcaC family oxidoreductase [Afipia broomeae]EKS41209.1 hypothetical protein HMPREF9695_00301 [Afipia broomeae ATCC 49717]RTL84285.1 MAG: SgcJ/EcaC family oxidoreductase [Bradyrhizobiaceae bacterium]
MRQLSLKLAACFYFFILGSHFASAGPAEDAAGVVTKWEKAFNAGEVDDIVRMYTTEATLFGTLSPSISSGPEPLKAYFAASAKNRTQVKLVDAPTVTKLSDSAFVLAGIYEFSGTRADGQSFSAPARYSLVVVDSGGQWRIAHQHSSPRPKPQ